MAKELQSAHVCVLPSLIENSPNSLAESMLVGTPAISSFVGGTPSMVRDEESLLFFPAGDEAVLAEQIRRIFLDDALACKLSEESKRVAIIRHSVSRVVDGGGNPRKDGGEHFEGLYISRFVLAAS